MIKHISISIAVHLIIIITWLACFNMSVLILESIINMKLSDAGTTGILLSFASLLLSFISMQLVFIAISTIVRKYKSI